MGWQGSRAGAHQRWGLAGLRSVGLTTALAAGLSAVLLAGCAQRSAQVRPLPTDPSAYRGWTCERLYDESDTVQQRAADVAYAVDARAGNNMIALGVGIAVFWPALLAMRPDGPEAAELAALKGRFEALKLAAEQQSCGPPAPLMSPARAAALPVAAGDRLVYDERQGSATAAHALGLKVLALKRDRIEFGIDLDGQALPGSWDQDLSGNPLPEVTAPLLRWRRLLRPGLELGQVLDGDLVAAHGVDQRARVRGQVVAIGPQVFDGRQFDVAVIEIFGDAPRDAQSDIGGTRLDGVMAVDRHSGVLLRLELRCGNAQFALRRRLLRVEAAAR